MVRGLVVVNVLVHVELNEAVCLPQKFLRR